MQIRYVLRTLENGGHDSALLCSSPSLLPLRSSLYHSRSASKFTLPGCSIHHLFELTGAMLSLSQLCMNVTDQNLPLRGQWLLVSNREISLNMLNVRQHRL